MRATYGERTLRAGDELRSDVGAGIRHDPIAAVENVLQGTKHDIWAVNVESAYHEEHQEPEQPYKDAPATKSMQQALSEVG